MPSSTDLHPSPTLDRKRCRLTELLLGYGHLAVAYSGGVDSTFLAAFAHQVLPGKVLLFNGLSASFPADEAQFVRDFAEQFQIRLITLNTNELEIEEYAANPTSRCYFCKTELFTRIRPLAEREGFHVLADGANADDLGDFRPGLKAALEQQVVHPLQEAGLTKADIRELSREMNLPTWDKPSFACLASRFPYGERITQRKLNRVEAAEKILRDRGFRIFRVRSHENLARIELGADEMARGFEMREELTRLFKQAGFAFVSLDLQGFRSGAMNEVLTAPPAEPPA